MKKNTKKLIVISIAIAFLILLVAGATYAYILTTIQSNNINTTTSGLLNINYTKGQNITGSLTYSSTYTGGLNTTVTISKTSTSLPAGVNIYLTPTVLSNTLKTSGALKWQVFGYQNATQVYSNSGNFNTATVNSPITIVNNQTVSTTVTSYTIYVWLDGTIADND